LKLVPASLGEVVVPFCAGFAEEVLLLVLIWLVELWAAVKEVDESEALDKVTKEPDGDIDGSGKELDNAEDMAADVPGVD
jgi:hypothetical protein